MKMQYTFIALCNAIIIIAKFCLCSSKSVGMTAETSLASNVKNTSNLYTALIRKLPINLQDVRIAEDTLCSRNGTLNVKSPWCDYIRRLKLSRHFVHSSPASNSEHGFESSESSLEQAPQFEYRTDSDIDPCPSFEKSDIHNVAFEFITGDEMIDIYPSHHVIRTCRHSTPTISLGQHGEQSRKYSAYCAPTRIRQERYVLKNGKWTVRSVYFENECKLFVKRGHHLHQSQVKSESTKENKNCGIPHVISFVAITFGIICLLLCISKHRRRSTIG